jgi:hypothetical protein
LQLSRSHLNSESKAQHSAHNSAPPFFLQAYQRSVQSGPQFSAFLWVLLKTCNLANEHHSQCSTVLV